MRLCLAVVLAVAAFAFYAVEAKQVKRAAVATPSPLDKLVADFDKKLAAAKLPTLTKTAQDLKLKPKRDVSPPKVKKAPKKAQKPKNVQKRQNKKNQKPKNRKPVQQRKHNNKKFNKKAHKKVRATRHAKNHAGKKHKF